MLPRLMAGGFATVVHHLSGWCLPHPGFLRGHHGAGVSSSRDATVVKTLYIYILWELVMPPFYAILILMGRLVLSY